MRLLFCLARAVVKNGLNLLLDAVPFGNALGDIARDTWDAYRQGKPTEAQTAAEVEGLAQAPAVQLRQQTEAAARQALPDRPDAQPALVAYLTQMPAQIRRVSRRPSDPSGRSVPAGLVPHRAEDLQRLLPPRPPGFKAGDKPLPGVDWELVELLGVGGFGEVWKARNPHLPSDPPVALRFCLDAAAAARTLRNEAAALNRVKNQGHYAGLVKLQHTYLSADKP